MRDRLSRRAQFIEGIRQFFKQRDVLEVETPLLCQHTVTDVHIESFQCEDRYLQTSPEYAMKRLLASDSGAIFQIAKAFRKGECGSQHNPEFSMLEWYRPGYDYLELIQEVDALLQAILNTPKAEMITYQDLFQRHLEIDPFNISLENLQQLLQQHHILESHSDIDVDTALQLLLTHLIEPKLGVERPLFIIDFPASQAALAKLKVSNTKVAERFEAYIKGKEVANGWTELVDADQQLQRFQRDQQQRQCMNKNIPEIDHYFIDALKQGLPECAGVAMGVDRLFMLKEEFGTIKQAISFSWEEI
ncbi:MAG: EF-P lysine aminoacylase GenX [Gammaproteobacteria bacterium]|nr:EF-P lysine aminoacylase GenX [Gammaproteobacteria bacterium]MCH9744336.1 EF-P lysine aminoacylase GenX [Gammaproteobacteria bacterium]